MIVIINLNMNFLVTSVLCVQKKFFRSVVCKMINNGLLTCFGAGGGQRCCIITLSDDVCTGEMIVKVSEIIL